MLIQTSIPARRDGTVLVDVPSGVHYVFAGEPSVCEVDDALDGQWLMALAGGARFVAADASSTGEPGLATDDGAGDMGGDDAVAGVVPGSDGADTPADTGGKKPRGRPRSQPVVTGTDPDESAGTNA